MTRANRPGVPGHTEQPMPITRPDLPSAHELAVVDIHYRTDVTEEARHAAIRCLRERARIGMERYGSPLTACNGRDTRRDAVEEATDLVAYLRAGVEEGWCPSPVYRGAVDVLVDLAYPRPGS